MLVRLADSLFQLEVAERFRVVAATPFPALQSGTSAREFPTPNAEFAPVISATVLAFPLLTNSIQLNSIAQ